MGDDEDKQSCIGSEGSMEDSNSVGLDTIAEDLDEVERAVLASALIPLHRLTLLRTCLSYSKPP